MRSLFYSSFIIFKFFLNSGVMPMNISKLMPGMTGQYGKVFSNEQGGDAAL